jgi:hypothetical protein
MESGQIEYIREENASDVRELQVFALLDMDDVK